MESELPIQKESICIDSDFFSFFVGPVNMILLTVNKSESATAKVLPRIVTKFVPSFLSLFVRFSFASSLQIAFQKKTIRKIERFHSNIVADAEVTEVEEVVL